MAVSIDLSGKCALVTGASRGIGREVALRLSEAGAKVALFGRSVEQLEALASEIGLKGGFAVVIAGDVSSAEQATAAVEKAIAAMGGLHILVSNAGVTEDGLLMRMSDEAWRKVIDTNLSGAFFFARAAARPLMKAKEGRIILTGSVIGLRGNAGQANYAASKAGLIGLAKSIARELGSRNVTCNVVAPGLVETDMSKKLTDEQRKAILDGVPLGRIGTPRDIADAVLFLAGPGGAYVTGAVIPVDGGLAM